jgi:hypothetical protein
MTSRADTRDLRARAEVMGFAITRTNGGHLKCVAPSGVFIFIAATPSDHRSTRNALAAMRRALRPVPPDAVTTRDNCHHG